MSLIYVPAVTYITIPIISFHQMTFFINGLLCLNARQAHSTLRQQQQHLFKHDKVTAELMWSCI